nr:probable LRR receptor-like serine/threonine-protein kinase At1g34110 [Ipomoea batatas]GME17832.1 probable LRR receptor-like serine/threonine-protein kinase At1g34110 [Ipomoea batatas]
MKNPCLFHLWTLLGFLLVGLEDYGSFSCLDEERVALLKIKDAFNYPNGSALSFWDDEGVECCKWERVECDNLTGRVTKLHLHDIRELKLGEFEFFLDASLFLPFQELQGLGLENNTIQGLKGELKLKKLQLLTLAQNQLTEIPSLGALLSLNYLNLASNYLKNLSDFNKLTTLRSLQILVFRNNQIRGNLPPSIGTFTSLKSLSFANNELNGSLPEEGFCGLRNIEELDLYSNSFDGSIPLCFSNLTSLKFLDLSSNRLTGTIPTTLFYRLSSLEHVSISDNHFEGSFSFSSFANNSKLQFFELHCNNRMLNIDTENPPWTPLFQLNFLRISNCELNEPSRVMPSFILTQGNLRLLELSNNSITGRIPTWLLKNNSGLQFLSLGGNFFTGSFVMNSDHWFGNLYWLDVSMNEIYGELPPLMGFIFSNLVYLRLSENAFQGKLSDGIMNSSQLEILSLKSNLISGKIPDWIGNLSSLGYLVLAENSLQGSIPLSFSGLQQLKLLYLSGNYLHQIPPGVNLSSLAYLHLADNELDGPLPSFISRLSSLISLDVRYNKFSGRIPSWLSSLTNLRTLLLKGNSLQSLIPAELCQLKNISILDLSFNNLSGKIPLCMCSMPFGEKKPLPIDGTFSSNIFGWSMPRIVAYEYVGLFGVLDYPMATHVSISVSENVQFLTKSRYEDFSYSILYFISGIDLSHNKFIGPIPPCIGYLSDIHSLNLSHNYLDGSIPKTLSMLKEIESMDLSYNRLTGEIPSELIALNFLSVFSVAYNNLSGRTPAMVGQFATFEKQSYEGNEFLCGMPLPADCGTNNTKLPELYDEGTNDSFIVEFQWSFLGSYIVAFLSVVAYLYCSPYHSMLLYEFFMTRFRTCVSPFRRR